jgi:hypothetical protein
MLRSSVAAFYAGLALVSTVSLGAVESSNCGAMSHPTPVPPANVLSPFRNHLEVGDLLISLIESILLQG